MDYKSSFTTYSYWLIHDIKMKKGEKMSEETKQKIRLSNLGKKHNVSEDGLIVIRRNLSKGHGWNKGKPNTPEWNEKVRQANIGKKYGLSTRLKHRERWLGSKNPNYIDGTSKESGIHYFDLQWKLWREAVYKRDNWTCQNCLKHTHDLEPHHIKGWAQYPELRYEISNGLTLCKECHKLTDNYMGKGKRKNTNPSLQK